MYKIMPFACALALGAAAANADDDTATEIVSHLENFGMIVGTLKACGDKERSDRLHKFGIM